MSIETTLEKETFRGRERFKVKSGGKVLGFVRRAPGTKSRWLWVKGCGPVCSPKNLASRAKAVNGLVKFIESEPPDLEPPKKLETIGRGRLFGRLRANRRNRRVRSRR